MYFHFFVSSLLICVGLLFGFSSEQCQSNEGTLFQGKCLRFSDTKHTYDTAKDDCNSKDGKLLEIPNKETETFLQSNNDFGWDFMWIGIIKNTGKGPWYSQTVLGPVIQYSNWLPLQAVCIIPSYCTANCAIFDFWHKGWSDTFCTESQNYICQYETDDPEDIIDDSEEAVNDPEAAVNDPEAAVNDPEAAAIDSDSKAVENNSKATLNGSKSWYINETFTATELEYSMINSTKTQTCNCSHCNTRIYSFEKQTTLSLSILRKILELEVTLRVDRKALSSYKRTKTSRNIDNRISSKTMGLIAVGVIVTVILWIIIPDFYHMTIYTVRSVNQYFYKGYRFGSSSSYNCDSDSVDYDSRFLPYGHPHS